MMHVVMVMMVVPPVVVVVVMMHLLHGRRRSGRSGRGGFLRPGVPRKADRESGRGNKTLDHGSTSRMKKTPFGLHAPQCGCSAELNMN
jgi:hypothetical protein